MKEKKKTPIISSPRRNMLDLRYKALKKTESGGGPGEFPASFAAKGLEVVGIENCWCVLKSEN